MAGTRSAGGPRWRAAQCYATAMNGQNGGIEMSDMLDLVEKGIDVVEDEGRAVYHGAAAAYEGYIEGDPDAVNEADAAKHYAEQGAHDAGLSDNAIHTTEEVAHTQ